MDGIDSKRIWDDVLPWRRAKRLELLARRRDLTPDMRDRIGAGVVANIERHIPDLAAHTVGFYWPIKGEIDLRALIAACLKAGATAALPVVTEKRQPLEFWHWTPGTKMRLGAWNIPVPAMRHVVRPTALLVPLLGHDDAGFRLGYGAGYYDRTLAALVPKPLTIGVGFEMARLHTIFPQAHDIPMDAIVTEAAFRWFDESRRPTPEPETTEVSSPTCAFGKDHPTYFGFMEPEEVLDLLNVLLEAERAGAKGASAMRLEHEKIGPLSTTMRDVARDEARFCAMLTGHIERLGGTPSQKTGGFYEKLMAIGGDAERVSFLNRGQGWVVRKLQEAIPKIQDDRLHRDLDDMLRVHEQNIAACERIVV